MATRNDLELEEKMNLIKEKERGLSHRELRDKFKISIGAVSNILKRKNEYLHDYETNVSISICLSSSFMNTLLY